MSDDILKLYPPTVIWTSEFDILRRDNEKFAERLKKVKRFGGMGIMPGVMHNYHTHNFESTQTKKFLEEEKLAF